MTGCCLATVVEIRILCSFVWMLTSGLDGRLWGDRPDLFFRLQWAQHLAFDFFFSLKGSVVLSVSCRFKRSNSKLRSLFGEMERARLDWSSVEKWEQVDERGRSGKAGTVGWALGCERLLLLSSLREGAAADLAWSKNFQVCSSCTT